MNEVHERVKSSFLRQGFMTYLKASIDKVEKGLVQISCEYHDGLSQQNGFFHGGVISSIADSACGYAALSAAPPGKDGLTVEFKVNFMRPGEAKKIIAIGKVIKAGKTLTVCEANVYDQTSEKLIASMMATIIITDIPESSIH